MTTFADLTPEQRAKSIGCWVDTPWGLGILIDTRTEWTEDVPVILATMRQRIAEDRWNWESITPRFDLPRAWNPDGTPPEVEQETITTQPHPRGSWNNNSEHPEYFPTPPGTRMRRWVGEWEPTQ